VTEWKEAVRKEALATENESMPTTNEEYSISDLQLTKAVSDRGGSDEHGEMEVFIGSQNYNSPFGVTNSDTNLYESYFPAELEAEFEDNEPSPASSGISGRKRTRQDAHADMDLALTLHQIAQLHRSQCEFARALDAYIVALRGMKYALGKQHPNVAAVLGNIGNLQKEMGDMDSAYCTYEEVLGIESSRLGLIHPDVAITLHNIATIDAARGNYDNALKLYHKVIGLEKKLFGNEHISVAVAAACMGDVYEKLGQYDKAVESYEEAVRIKSLCLGRHSVDVARLLHKLGKLAFLDEDFHMAESYVSRALLMYRLNKIDEEHSWMVDANRDAADIDAALVVDQDRPCKC
jgi:tetratricopeptide (TPR) repeat protein